MRMSREATAASKRRILDAAARRLRERGIEATSIADVMHDADMKHGGFYKHFESKEDLVSQAISAAFGERAAAFDARRDQDGARAAVAAYVETYLSAAHVDHLGYGCPVAGFGTDAGRARDAYAQAFSEGMEQLVARLGGDPGASSEARRATIRQLCLMVGTIVVARASGQSRLREEALAAAAEALSPILGDS